MATYQFKTNIHCDGCIAKITPYLNQVKELDSWQVDLKDPAKILTVEAPESANINEQVTKQLHEAGYQIEPLG